MYIYLHSSIYIYVCVCHIYIYIYIVLYIYMCVYILYISRGRYQLPQTFCNPHASCPATAGNGLGETETSGADSTID